MGRGRDLGSCSTPDRPDWSCSNRHGSPPRGGGHRATKVEEAADGRHRGRCWDPKSTRYEGMTGGHEMQSLQWRRGRTSPASRQLTPRTPQREGHSRNRATLYRRYLAKFLDGLRTDRATTPLPVQALNTGQRHEVLNTDRRHRRPGRQKRPAASPSPEPQATATLSARLAASPSTPADARLRRNRAPPSMTVRPTTPESARRDHASTCPRVEAVGQTLLTMDLAQRALAGSRVEDGAP